jgi:ankyrin repeat protein
VEEVKKYLDQYTNDLVNKLEAQSRQPSLYFSVLNKSYEIMKMLIDHGANPNFKDQYIQTVFFYTCREGTRMIFSGKEKCFDLLLDLGVVID